MKYPTFFIVCFFFVALPLLGQLPPAYDGGGGGGGLATLPGGVESDAAPPWVGSVTTGQGAGAVVPIDTGVDLNNVDSLLVSFVRSNGLWPTTKRVRLDLMIKNAAQGEMLSHYNDDYVALMLSDADVATGRLQVYAGGGIDFTITRIEFKTSSPDPATTISGTTVTNPNEAGVLTSNEDGTATFVAKPSVQFNTLQSNFVFNSTTLTKIPDLEFNVVAGQRYKFKFGLRQTIAEAAADMRLQVTGPAASGVTAYQNIENAVSRAPDWGVASLNITLATIAAANGIPNADVHYAEGWLIANADGVVEINIRNNTGMASQTIGVGSWVEAYQIAN